MGARPGDDGGPTIADARVQPDATIPVIDAAPPGPPDAALGVGCGNQTCTAGNVCCVQLSGGGGSMYECKDKCDGNQGTFACDGPEDCPGQDCCFGRTSSACASSCGFGDSVACRSDQDCGGADQCCPTQYPNVELCGLICF